MLKRLTFVILVAVCFPAKAELIDTKTTAEMLGKKLEKAIRWADADDLECERVGDVTECHTAVDRMRVIAYADAPSDIPGVVVITSAISDSDNMPRCTEAVLKALRPSLSEAAIDKALSSLFKKARRGRSEPEISFDTMQLRIERIEDNLFLGIKGE